MFKTIVYLFAWIAGFCSAFRKRKPEPFEPKEIDRTLDPDYPKAFIICSPWNGKSRGSPPPHAPPGVSWCLWGCHRRVLGGVSRTQNRYLFGVNIFPPGIIIVADQIPSPGRLGDRTHNLFCMLRYRLF